MYTNNCANTTLLGKGWIVLKKSQRSIVIVGFAKDLQKENLPIVNAVAKTMLPNNRSILLQVNEAAYMGEGDTLFSKNQVGSHGIQIDDDSYFGQEVICSEKEIGDDIPLYFEGALTFLKIDHPTNKDLENPDTLQLTSNQP